VLRQFVLEDNGMESDDEFNQFVMN
jgi:hypothetical protein